jgi:hypothetical protein
VIEDVGRRKGVGGKGKLVEKKREMLDESWMRRVEKG